MLPTSPVRQFQLVYCLWLAAAMLVHMRRHSLFYDWFFNSGCAAQLAAGARDPLITCLLP